MQDSSLVAAHASHCYTTVIFLLYVPASTNSPCAYALLEHGLRPGACRHRLSLSSHAAGGGSAQQRTATAAAGAAAGAGDKDGKKQLKLSTYLPEKVVAAFQEAGLTSDLYEWQVPSMAHLLKGADLPSVTQHL